MSIFPADATTLPAAVTVEPTTLPADASSSLMLWIFIGWAVLGLVVAERLGAFKSKTVRGPARLSSFEAAWDLALVIFIAFAVQVVIGGLLISRMHADTGLKQLVLGAVVDGSMLVSVVSTLFFLRPGSLTRLGLKRLSIGTGLIGGAATLFALYPLVQLTSAAVDFIYTRFNLTKASPHEVLQIIGNTHSAGLVVFAVFVAVIIAPVTEELFYRGLMQTMLAQFFHWMLSRASGTAELSPVISPVPAARWLAIIVTSVIFAAVHVEPAFLAPIFVLAIGLGYVYERTGNLWVTMAAHALFNAAQISLYRASLP